MSFRYVLHCKQVKVFRRQMIMSQQGQDSYMAEKGAVALMQRLFFNSNVGIIDFYSYLSRMLNCRELYNQKAP